MAFVFPIFERYLNNMVVYIYSFPYSNQFVQRFIIKQFFQSFDEYLLKYAVRVRDVELLTGFDFFSDPDFYPLDLSLQLRTSIVEQLWSA
jgi:hypothetical protein